MNALPRTTRAAAAIALVAAGLVTVATPALAKAKAPVELDGKVNEKGVGTAKNGTAKIKLDDFFFKKTFVKTPSGSVTVELKNKGSAQHSFTIDDQNIDVVLAPGTKKTVTVVAGDSAPTEFYCKFHVGSGMQGALFVTADASGTATTKSEKDSAGSGGYDYGS